MNKKVIKRGLIPYAFLLVFFLVIMTLVNTMNTEVHELNYSKFMKEVESGEVKEITVTPHANASIYTISGKLKDYKSNETFTFSMPLTDETMVKILEAEKEANFTVKTAADAITNFCHKLFTNNNPYRSNLICD